jgi:hypothetical protein
MIASLPSMNSASRVPKQGHLFKLVEHCMAGKIFINYRRGDEPGFAGRLFDRLEQAFHPDQLFMDVDSIAPGHDFVRVLEDQVAQCDVFLAIIGQEWIAAQDDQGRRRLDKPDDFVRIEIESGLKLGKRVIPVLINNAQMPSAELLPDPLKPLARRNAVRLTHDRFRADAQGLINVVETALGETEAARQAANDAETLRLQKIKEEEATKAEQATQAEKEQARLKAIAGLSPQDIAKAEELANWEFIKGQTDTQELRDHLARYRNGATARFARAALEDIVWKGLISPDLRALDEFLAKFPDGRHASQAKLMCDKLVSDAKAKQAAQIQKRQEVEAWATASAAGDVTAMEAFLKEWPNGINAKAARARLKELKGGGSRFSRRATQISAGCALVLIVIYLVLPTLLFDLTEGQSIEGSFRGGQLYYDKYSTHFGCIAVCVTTSNCVGFMLHDQQCHLYSTISRMEPRTDCFSGIRRY